MAGALLSHVMFTARVHHFVYVILVTRHVVFTVRLLLRACPPYCLRHTLLLRDCLQEARINILFPNRLKYQHIPML
jgi:hypothetical protein